MLEKACRLTVRVLRARVPRMTRPLNTIITPRRSDTAQRNASARFVLESVFSNTMGFCAPVRMMGLGEYWMR